MSVEPDYNQWQAYLDDELSPSERLAVEAALAEDANQRSAFEQFASELQETNALFQPVRELSKQFQVEKHWNQLATELEGRNKSKAGSPWFLWFSLTASVSLVGLLVFVLKPWEAVPIKPTTTRQWLTKGTSFSMLHQHKTEKKSVRTQNGDSLYEGDFVQCTYHISKPMHVMVISISEKGAISKYIPLDSPNSQKVLPGKGTLPKREAIELDNSLGLELFVVLASKKTFTFSEVKKALANTYPRNSSSLKSLKLSKFAKWSVLYTVWIRKKRSGSSPKP